MAAPPFKVKALFDYSSPHDDDLDFSLGQIITVTEEEDADWYCGEYVDAAGAKQEGIFPRNFVERFEPETPPRPARSHRPKKEPEIPPQDPSHGVGKDAEETTAGDSTSTIVPAPSKKTPAPQKVPSATGPAHPPVEPSAGQSSPTPAASQSKAPHVAEKPSGGSFKDRIAAFNKSTAPPIAPFKPGNLGGTGSSFIKKPFIAPPPSKDAYVPTPRETPVAKIYRREEDPEIVGRATDDAETAEPTVNASTPTVDTNEEQQKPTSLKERIALLQKQQQEQAARHVEAAQKKEKPKRPQKKRMESTEQVATHDEGSDGADVERLNSAQMVGKRSGEAARDEPATSSRSVKHKTAAETVPAAPSGTGSRDILSDANDADQSGAGETTEDAEETSTGVDDSDHKPKSRQPTLPVRTPTAPTEEREGEKVAGGGSEDEEDDDQDEDEDEGEGEEEEEEVDPEARRRMEIRERMAKMSGGMGMHGMFGAPGGMPPPMAGGPKKAKGSGSSTRGAIDRGEDAAAGGKSTSHAPPVPVMLLPGMGSARTREPPEAPAVVHADDEARRGVAALTQDPEEIEDVEEVATEPARPARPVRQGTSPSVHHERAPPEPTNAHERAPPPPPAGRPAPPPPPTHPSTFLSEGSDSDDEMPTNSRGVVVDSSSTETPGQASHATTPIPPTAGAPPVPGRPVPASPRPLQRANAHPSSPLAPAYQDETQRMPKSHPDAEPPTMPPARPAPPAPPSIPARTLSRKSTGDSKPLRQPKAPVPDESDEEVTEYEGDYDTDIASGATHKEALKSHAREPSGDDSTTVDEASSAGPAAPLPVPVASVPHSTPPPPPSQPPKAARSSAEMPRGAPPPVPPSKEAPGSGDPDEYDPFCYAGPSHGVALGEPRMGPTVTSPPPDRYEDDPYFA
ncbi:MAG: hypothetical protein M1838_003604, partial [Thelocarpon superellum]